MDTRERGWPASLVRIAAILTFVASWEIVARSGMVGSILLPPPSVVARTGWRLVSSQELFGHVWSSLFRVLLAQLLLDRTELLAQEILPLLATHFTLRLAIDLVAEFEHLQFVREVTMQQPRRVQARWCFQERLLLVQVEAEE